MKGHILSFGFFSLLFCWSCNSPSPEEKTEPETVLPNILLIVADDHGNADFSTLNLLEDVSTPNLDALAASGIRFTQAYASSPICSPSRMSLITGAYNQRFGTFWYGGNGIHREDLKTIPELLKQKNYATGYIGKVHYGKQDSDTTNRCFPLNHGFDYFFGHTSARKHYINHQKSIEQDFLARKATHQKTGQSLRQGALWRNFNPVDTIAFATTMFGEEARQFMSKHQHQPFFLQLSFNAVHNFTHQLPKEYLKDNNLKGYRDWDPAVEDYYDWYQEGRWPNNPEGRAHYLGQLHYLDTEVGKVMAHLESLGIKENTLVIYIGDNGGSTPIYANNQPLRGSKYTLYEGGIRVPLLVAFPKKYKGQRVVNNLVSNLDILPTICQVAGINIPNNTDGINLNDLLEGKDPSVAHDTLYWDTGHERAIRTANWKWHEVTDTKSADYEMVDLELGANLRDLAEDIGETKDFSKANEATAQALKAQLESWQQSIQLDLSKDR